MDLMHTSLPGLVIAAPQSGAGKTTVSLGLMRALAKGQSTVQPFKCGPDYIDGAFHEVATGRKCFNLDTWSMSRERIFSLVSTAGQGADIGVAEGVMGLFDGAACRGRAGHGSTADVAALLGWPVVLIIDVTGQAETAAAIALGCARFRDDVEIAGVILNRVAGKRHRALVEPAFASIGIGVLGALPREQWLTLPERHLGLVQARELTDVGKRIDAIAAAVADAVDLSALRSLAKPLAAASAGGHELPRCGDPRPPGQRIALACDDAFAFVYPHLVALWRRAGAEIVGFSPLANEPPDGGADAIWLPGGYPELHAGRLAAADRFLGGLRAAAARGTPVHGECGGYMVLGSGIVDATGRRHAMAGLLSLETSFAARRLHLGYRRARLLADSSLGRANDIVLGHEFHYASTLANLDAPLLACSDGSGAMLDACGARRGCVSGTFFHLIDSEMSRP
jgi:cobyrinic acid a,c-diamide synthase